MKLCQIYIAPGASNVLPTRSYYTAGLNGKYEARVIGITWADTTNAKDNRLIRISSDCFRTVAGTFPQTIAFCNRHEQNMGNPQGMLPIELDVVGGRIDLTVEASTAYDGSANNAFNFAILTLEVSPIPRD